jgi:hypothetical protein
MYLWQPSVHCFRRQAIHEPQKGYIVIRRRVATLIVALMAAGVAAVVLAPQSANAQPGWPASCYPVSPLFVGRYNQAPAQYGCAAGWDFGRDGGYVQDFAYGQMATSPRQGANMIVSAFHSTYWTDAGLRHALTLRWNTSSPFNYDRWLIRIDYNGSYAWQPECAANTWLSGCDRYSGTIGWNNVTPGLYRFVLEGCDYDAWGGTTCTQGWTNPIWIWF